LPALGPATIRGVPTAPIMVGKARFPLPRSWPDRDRGAPAPPWVTLSVPANAHVPPAARRTPARTAAILADRCHHRPYPPVRPTGRRDGVAYLPGGVAVTGIPGHRHPRRSRSRTGSATRRGRRWPQGIGAGPMTVGLTGSATRTASHPGARGTSLTG